MINKKYKILKDEENTIKWKGRTLHRIKSLRDFGDVEKGDIGGFVENEDNLSHKGNCWIYDNAKAMDNSRLRGNSEMHDYSEMHGNSEMYDYNIMYDYSIMYGNSKMHDYSKMYGNSEMHGNSELNNNDQLYGKLVSKVDDFIEINNPRGRLVTCVRKGNNIFYNVGCQDEIDEETFKDRIEHTNGGLENNPHREYYYKIIHAGKIILLNK